jgi:hypothetical protein
MKSQKLALVVLATIVMGVAVIIIARSGQSQSKNVQHSLIIEEDIPTADFDAPKLINSKEKEIRELRGKKYTSGIPLEKLEGENGILEDPDLYSVEPAFPVGQSDVIILGTVTDSRAFISNDKTAVYSEFQVTVDQIIKNDKNRSVTEKSNLVVERVGGNVRFPSGKIVRRGEDGHNLPRKNTQYFLFLKWEEEGKDFSIVTGYKVHGQTVYPLDGFATQNPRVYENYDLYKNANLSEFLSKLREAIDHPSVGEVKK